MICAFYNILCVSSATEIYLRVLTSKLFISDTFIHVWRYIMKKKKKIAKKYYLVSIWAIIFIYIYTHTVFDIRYLNYKY